MHACLAILGHGSVHTWWKYRSRNWVRGGLRCSYLNIFVMVYEWKSHGGDIILRDGQWPPIMLAAQHFHSHVPLKKSWSTNFEKIVRDLPCILSMKAKWKSHGKMEQMGSIILTPTQNGQVTSILWCTSMSQMYIVNGNYYRPFVGLTSRI